MISRSLQSNKETLRTYIHEFEKAETFDGSFREPHFNDDPPFMTTNIWIRTLYEKIIQAKWFSRAWRMHETRLGKRHIFLIRCEHQPESPPMVLRFTNMFMLHLLSLASKIRPKMNPTWLLPVLAKAVEDDMGVERRFSSYMVVFAETFSKGAGGNPRVESPEMREFDANLDKLSIAMNTIDVGLAVSRQARDLENRLPPPPPDECCRWYTIVAIAGLDPSALCTSGLELQTKLARRSWMRWPLFSDVPYNLPPLNSFAIGFGPSPASSWIALQIALSNGSAGLRWATESSLRISTKAFLRWASIGGIQITLVGRIPNKIRRDLITKTLACVMDCGLEWLTSTSNDCYRYGYCTPSAKAGLQKLLESKGDVSQDDSAKSTLMWAADEKLEAQSLINLVAYLIRQGPAVEPGQNMEFWQPVCIANKMGSKVLTFFRGLPEKEIFCAMPLILLPEPYSELSRAWTLVKGNPEREQQPNKYWCRKCHLMGKSRIFGSVLSNGEHALDTIVDEVKVYGPIDLPL